MSVIQSVGLGDMLVVPSILARFVPADEQDRKRRARGRVVLDAECVIRAPEVAGRVIALFRDVRPPSLADHHLTPYELRLLGLLVEGHSYKSAAAALDSSVNTIAFHMKSIYAKLHVHSKSEAVAKALRHRIVR